MKKGKAWVFRRENKGGGIEDVPTLETKKNRGTIK